MTTTFSFATTNGREVESFHASSWSTMYAGGGTFTLSSGSPMRYGVGASSGDPTACQVFDEYAYTLDNDLIIASAYLRYTYLSSGLSGSNRNLVIKEYDWGASVTSADWRTPSQFSALDTLGEVEFVNTAVGGQYILAGGEALLDRLKTTGTLKTVGTTNSFTAQIEPSVSAMTNLYAWAHSGTVDDPCLVYTTIPRSKLAQVLGAQMQLSDGTWCALESSGSSSPTVVLAHHDGSTRTFIATVPTGTGAGDFSEAPGAQAISLVVDDSDNLYVLGALGSSTNNIGAKAYSKGVGHSWTAQTMRSAPMTAYDASINNVVGAWHDRGGSFGTIVALCAHTFGHAAASHTGHVSYALLSCDRLLTGSGGTLRGSGNATGLVISSTAAGAYFNLAVNDTGAMLDVSASPTGDAIGFVTSVHRYTGLGDDNYSSIGYYSLNSSGTAIATSNTNSTLVTPYVSRDGGAKMRVIAISDLMFFVGAVDPDTDWGMGGSVVSYSGGTFTKLGTIRLDRDGPTSIPTPSGQAIAPTWDVVYDEIDNRLLFYYLDAADSNRLLRTSVSLDTMLAFGDETEVDAAVGAVGSTNHAVRVSRSAQSGDEVLVSVANETSGGTHSIVYILDTFNQPPTAPTLTAKANYDATVAGTFAWTFNDPNPGDTQTAYQVQIVDASDFSLDYDTGKVSAAAATFIGAGVAATGNNASVAPAVPSGEAGDTLIGFATIRNSGTGTVDTPSGWETLLDFGNTRLFGKVATAAAESAPTVTFTGGVANADTIAQVARFRNLPLRAYATATLLNASAQNISYPALTVAHDDSVVLLAGWKQDDWTSVAGATGTEIGEPDTTTGDDAGQVWNYVIQTTASSIAASSFTVTGGVAAISRGLVLALGPAGHTATNSSHVLPADTLANTRSYQWRVRTWDSEDEASPWSAYGTFSTAAGGTVTVTDPASDNPAGVITDNYVITWSVSGTTQAAYRVRLYRTDTEVLLSDTGWVTSTDTTYDVTGMLTGVEHRIEVQARNAGLVESAAGSRLITPDFGSPETPTIVVTAHGSAGYVSVAVTNPAPTGDRPEVIRNDILRREADAGGDWTLIGTAEPDGEYRDYTARPGVELEYIARGVSA